MVTAAKAVPAAASAGTGANKMASGISALATDRRAQRSVSQGNLHVQCLETCMKQDTRALVPVGCLS